MNVTLRSGPIVAASTDSLLRGRAKKRLISGYSD